MTAARAWPQAVLLSDGRALAVGTGGYGLGSASAEAWDPTTAAWVAVESLNKPRTGFVAVTLVDGRVLVTGGLNQGTVATGPDVDPAWSCEGSDQQSFSSTYVYDPGSGAWVKAGLLGVARTSPAAALLPDGRVLVAGGYFYQKPDYGSSSSPLVVAAAGGPALAGITAVFAPRADVEVPPHGYALATAELFDPATGTWSATGSLRYARSGAQAVTLTDGRVLVVSAEDGVVMDDGAFTTAEIYDPQTGRFTLTGSLPAIDWSALTSAGAPSRIEGDPQPESVGTLVALDDGGALLVGYSEWWKHAGEISRSFRYDAQTGRWSEVGQTWLSEWDPATDKEWQTPGDRRLHAFVARLGDGRVLIAGGDALSEDGVTRSAELYDPTTNAWTQLPPMPEPRAGGSAVTLADGSVLLVGGYNASWPASSCDEPYGMTTVIRFAPAAPAP